MDEVDDISGCGATTPISFTCCLPGYDSGYVLVLSLDENVKLLSGRGCDTSMTPTLEV